MRASAICLIALLFAPFARGDVAATGLLSPGVWISDDYGYVAHVDARHVHTFDVTAVGCVRGPRYTRERFRDFFGAIVAEQQTVSLQRGLTRELLRRAAELPASCRRPLRTKDTATNLDVFAATFAERYAFFGVRGVDWNRQVQTARSSLAGRADLFDTLVAAVRPLDDGHVTLSAGKRGYDVDRIIAPGTAPDGAPWTWRTLRSSLRDYLQSPASPLTSPLAFAGNRRVLYGRLTTGAAYIAVLAEGGWLEGQTEDTPPPQHVAAAADVLDKVLGELKGATHLVLDLRVNSGGFDAVSMEIAARFADLARVVFRKHSQGPSGATTPYDVTLEPSERKRFNGPVAVLVGPNTVSAGESLALALAAFPQVRLIGRPTRGEVSDAIPKTLPNGWTFTLSTESYLTPDGMVVEARGVQPAELTSASTSTAPEQLWGADLAAARRWLESPAAR
jgi:hypothetical protein